jgi:peptidoglycan/LPS O-acetylase OafA/YrhL
VPSFLLGMWIAPYIKQEKEICHADVICIVSFVLFIVCTYLFEGGEMGAPFIMISILAFFLVLLHYCNYTIKRVYGFMGKISLESYMLNVTLPFFLIHRTNWNIGIDFGYGNYLPYSFVVIFGILGSWLINKLSGFIISKI